MLGSSVGHRSSNRVGGTPFGSVVSVEYISIGVLPSVIASAKVNFALLTMLTALETSKYMLSPVFDACDTKALSNTGLESNNGAVFDHVISFSGRGSSI